MKKDEEKRITWFLKFISTNLSSIGGDEKLNLSLQTINIIFGMPELIFEEKDRPEMPADRWEGDRTLTETIDKWQKENKLEMCQKHLKRYFDDMMATINEAKIFAEKWTPEFNNYFCLGQIDSKLKLRIESPLIEFEVPKVLDKGEKNERILFRLKQDSLLNAPLRLAFKATIEEDTLLFYFFDALQGVPIGALRQCPECGLYFLHLTKKPKTYCSNNCAARKNVRDKRKAMKKDAPEAYEKTLAEEADRARRDYRKKVPNGKPARRPWKYKDSKEE